MLNSGHHGQHGISDMAATYSNVGYATARLFHQSDDVSTSSNAVDIVYHTGMFSYNNWLNLFNLVNDNVFNDFNN